MGNTLLRATAFFAALAFGCSADAPPAGPTGASGGDRTVIGRDEYTPSSTTTPAASSTGPSTVVERDASVPDATPKPSPTTAKECFQALEGAIVGPNYDKFAPVMGKNCAGTKHQAIAGVERLVFLGDSVTTGTPPTMPWEYYRARVEASVKAKFGSAVAVSDCSKWGARNDDFLEGGKQIEKCFPTGVEAKKTLVVMTMGGNDIHAWMKDKLSAVDALKAADDSAAKLRDAVTWLKSPTHFPNGSFVVFANVYEYTDTSGDLLSCPQAALDGTSGTWTEGTAAVVHLQEEYMRIAVDTKSDIVFLLESFCGHGYRRNDATLQCYRGANAELWFDLTCIHPTPKGHEVIAKLFSDVIAP
ncbi:MAG: SGNH/GDSL hydrolase family protein [Myxococcales bacterium]|nr:SGNH/GDSL hydrolase family protein [Myxococcales bacterium]